MEWTKREYTKQEYDAAGRTLVDPAATDAEVDAALVVVNNYRSAVDYPLNHMQVNLRSNAGQCDPEAVVAQRKKRRTSIEPKLAKPISLTKIQDIGGCRAVVSTNLELGWLRERYSATRAAHELIKTNDYIAEPKPDGYRSLHLVYSYRGGQDKDWDGIPIEVQLRTRLMHAWATAVEAVDMFTGQSLKNGQGEDEWKRFFQLASTAIGNFEGLPAIETTPSDIAMLRRELKLYNTHLDALNKLQAFGQTLQYAADEGPEGREMYYTMQLRPAKGNQPPALEVWAWHRSDLDLAQSDVSRLEEAAVPGEHIVLVSVKALNELRRAYPNYYLDTAVFRETIQAFIDDA